MINVSYIEENLDKLNSVYSLISLLEVHYTISRHKLSDGLSKAKGHLNKAVICFATDINCKVCNEQDKNNTLIISEEVTSALANLEPFFSSKELKNSEVLRQDTLEVILFLNQYEKEQNFDFTNQNHLDALKRKLTLFID